MHNLMGGLESATSVDWRRLSSGPGGASASSPSSAPSRDTARKAQMKQRQQQQTATRNAPIAHSVPDGMPGETELLKLASDPSQLAAQLSNMEVRLLPALAELQSGEIRHRGHAQVTLSCQQLLGKSDLVGCASGVPPSAAGQAAHGQQMPRHMQPGMRRQQQLNQHGAAKAHGGSASTVGSDHRVRIPLQPLAQQQQGPIHQQELHQREQAVRIQHPEHVLSLVPAKIPNKTAAGTHGFACCCVHALVYRRLKLSWQNSCASSRSCRATLMHRLPGCDRSGNS